MVLQICCGWNITKSLLRTGLPKHLQAASGADLQVALIDLRLGRDNGLDLVRELRTMQPELVAVILTAYASLETTIQAVATGAYDYLCKPFHTADLFATLERCFERYRLSRERRQALAELQARNRDLARSEERLRRIIEHSPSAISFEEPDGNCLLANERFHEWFPVGIKARIESDGEKSLATRDVMARGETVTSQLALRDGDRIRYVLVTRFPVLDAAQHPIGVGTIGTDVTERHLAEERLQRAERLAAIGQLAGGIAHDFNNVLTVVLGNLRLLEDEIRGQSDLGELLGDAMAATLSGVQQVERLLAVGSSQPLKPEITDATLLVRRVSRLLGRVLGGAIEIVLYIAPDLWLVRIDRGQLESSLLNLAVNARDAMPNGGRLTIALQNKERSALDSQREPDIRQGRYLRLSVSDNGIGMPPDVRRQAMQPFYTTKPIGRGSGLGLSMVYGFVRQSGGHVEIASECGQGTTVTLYIPAADDKAEREVAGSDDRQVSNLSGYGEQILLVEDQPRVRQVLRRRLLQLGYQVLDVADAEAAWQHIRSPQRIDGLIADVILPGTLTGVQLCELALSQRPTLVAILMTGYAADVLGKLTGRLADIPVLRKPLDLEQLASTLRQGLGQPCRIDRAGAEPSVSVVGASM